MTSASEWQKEISGLTGRLRSEESWNCTRKMLLENGYNPNEIILLAFMESEECLEWGLFLTPDDRVLEWEVDTNNGYQLKSIIEKDESEFANYGDAVEVGKKMKAAFDLNDQKYT